jgi:hypothetical protein
VEKITTISRVFPRGASNAGAKRKELDECKKARM